MKCPLISVEKTNHNFFPQSLCSSGQSARTLSRVSASFFWGRKKGLTELLALAMSEEGIRGRGTRKQAEAVLNTYDCIAAPATRWQECLSWASAEKMDVVRNFCGANLRWLILVDLVSSIMDRTGHLLLTTDADSTLAVAMLNNVFTYGGSRYASL